ncbi:rCG52862, isoform CRA_b [Rattus norvegicus]|nr:rCG52862, isoform CRA_b [Rattus norvegicus]
MFLSMCFCWHYASIVMLIGVIFALANWLVKSRLRKVCTSEVGLLKHVDREQESEEEV